MMKNYHHLGHKKIIHIFEKQVKDQKIHHAYLFIGPANVGKLDLAKYFATLIHTKRNDSLVREKIECGIHPDTVIVSPQRAKKTFRQSISIAKIKEVQKKIYLSPYSSNFKVGIISGAHLMTQEAANAFLKSLEEPPKNSILILTTTKENLIMPTILSRCQKFYLSVVKKEEILKNLLSTGLDQDKAETISRLAAGKVGLAMRFRDKENLRNYLDNLSMLEKIFNLNDAEKIKAVEEIHKTKDISEILDHWLIYFRDILAAKKDLDEFIINIGKIDKIKKNSQKLDLEKSEKMIKGIMEGQNLLAANVNSRLVLENLVLQL